MPRSTVGSNSLQARGRPRAGGTKTVGNSKTNKIVIRPYAKPPQLPDNYYEETSQLILQGTLAALKGTSHSKSSNTTSPQPQLSLQNAYQACLHLVRHHYGARLYQDLVLALKEAAEFVLPSNNDTTGLSSGNNLLPYVCRQYHTYTDFLLLLKHICLPLDNANAAQQHQHALSSGSGSGGVASAAAGASNTASTQQQQQPTTATATTPSSGINSSTGGVSSNHNTSLWSTGLAVFLERLQLLEWDVELYRQWRTQFLRDWEQPESGSGVGGSGAVSDGMMVDCNGGCDRGILQQVWYLFQDLQILPHLPLQHDLEEHWAEVARQWQTNKRSLSSGGEYPLRQFLQLCTNKHARCWQWRPWLHPAWLWRILDEQLVRPHLTSDYLLKDEHLFPVLLEQLRSSSNNRHSSSGIGHGGHSSHSMNTNMTPVQQLWMLAGRLPGGQTAVAAAIQRFARQQGLLAVQKPPPAAVPELLELQQQLAHMLAGLSSSSASAITTASGSSNAVSTANATGTGTTPNKGKSTQQQQQQASPISLKSVWEEVVNVDVTPSISEQLAKFLDSILRSNKKMDQYSSATTSAAASIHTNTATAGNSAAAVVVVGASDAWLQRILNGLFVPLNNKDIFEAFYKRDLAKRLLWNRVVSMDVEKQVCSLLKAECGAAYTSKMEGMFQDVDWSRETMLVYKQSLQGVLSSTAVSASPSTTSASTTTTTSASSSSGAVEVEVQVLTTGYWPVYPQYPNLQLPDSLKEPQEQFANHYKTKYQGRRMTWQYALGHCVVRANGFAKPYELIVSLTQALVLIQFGSSSSDADDRDEWTLPQLMHATGLEDRDEMERILQSLALGKDGTRILRKLDHDATPPTATSPAAGDASKKKKTRLNVDDHDRFVVNAQFSSNARRIRIQNVMMKETREERAKTVQTVARDRLYLIDAVLVRIMKARKTVLHQALIPQVLEQVKVPAQPADVKKRIEILIEREYIERDAKDRNRYNYLA